MFLLVVLFEQSTITHPFFKNDTACYFMGLSVTIRTKSKPISASPLLPILNESVFVSVTYVRLVTLS